MSGSQEIEIVRSVVRNGRQVKRVFNLDSFTVECQGGAGIKAQTVAVDYRDGEPDDERPGNFVLINDSDLGKAAAGITGEGPVEDLADEMIDKLCLQAGCNGGGSCIKLIKRKK